MPYNNYICVKLLLMKTRIFILIFTLLVFSCKKEETKQYATFGKEINDNDALSKEEMTNKYLALKEGDTLNVKFASTIKEICQKKGCWMSLQLDKDNEAFVKFKDYGFFVPMNAQNKEVVVNGKAFVSVTTVDELKHYAKDEGKSQEEINTITQPEVTYSFLADGVLIAK